MQNSLITRALKKLKKDTRLLPLIRKYPEPEFDRRQHDLNHFHALIRAIIFQQLSGKAAQTILVRFLALYPKGSFPTPKELLKTSSKKIRSAGISAQKAGYLKDLALKFLDGTIQPKKFSRMTNEEVFEHVVSVKGIGSWTTDMFLMFTLQRPDVLPVGDLGIQKAFKKLFKLRTLPAPEKMRALAESWRPYRTIACWYLWRLADEGNNDR